VLIIEYIYREMPYTMDKENGEKVIFQDLTPQLYFWTKGVTL